jgi:phospholipid-binding lipoprotein MlaA
VLKEENMKRLVVAIVGVLVLGVCAPFSWAAGPAFSPDGVNPVGEAGQGGERVLVASSLELGPTGIGAGGEAEPGLEEGGASMAAMPDPLQRINRGLFAFNDKVYFWLLKPAARGWGFVLPKRVRISVKNFFTNIYAPVRILNCGLQCDGKGALTETKRFAINTTIGLVGFFDPATSTFKLDMRDEDFGQTLGCRKGPGFYLDLPFLGPSSLRDGFGTIVDWCIVPSLYVLIYSPWYYTAGANVLEIVNRTSLRIGEYEDLKKAALDPYVSVRDAYHQYREGLILK